MHMQNLQLLCSFLNFEQDVASLFIALRGRNHVTTNPLRNPVVVVVVGSHVSEWVRHFVIMGRERPGTAMTSRSRPAKLKLDGVGDVYDVPISDIIRPLESTVDKAKVESLCLTIQQNPSEVPPVTLLWLNGESGSDYFFGFGGCHRYEAYKKLGRETIPSVLQKSNISSLKAMMGASTPTILP